MVFKELPPEVSKVASRLPDVVLEMERTAPYAAASLAGSRGLRISVNDREQVVTEVPPSQGLVLSAWNGSFFEESATSEVTAQQAFQLARSLTSRMQLAPTSTRLDSGPTLRQHFSTDCVRDPASLSTKEKLELCIDVLRRARKLDTRIVNVQVDYTETLESKVFANRNRLLSQGVQRMRFGVVIMVSDGQRMQYDWLGKDGTGGLELIEISDDELLKLCDNAIALLSAGRIPPGMYEVICSPDVSGVIAHEAFGHGVELDMFLKDRARSRQYLGKAIASPLVDILDDPSYPGGHGTYFFDDEGQLAAPTYIIRQGVFERGLSDHYSAHSLCMPHTANGRRESFERKIYVRMSNTFFGRGQTPVQSMLDSVEHGIYLQHTSSGMEDPKGWGMQVTSHYGEEIVNGKLTGKRFAPIGITGYVPDILHSVSMVGDDFLLSGGTCGKGHKEWVPVSSGGPHLRLKARLG